MTQDKKFKKAVRARMKQTGETYMQARRALGGDDRKVERPRDARYVLIGYWKSVQELHWPDPLEMVDASWDAEERAKVVKYLRAGRVVAHEMGESWCRLGCGTERDMARARTVFHGDGTTDAELGWEERLEARKQAARRAEDANMTGAPVDMGTGEISDGTYVWPEGLAHYVEEHNVRLPQKFVDHVLAGGTTLPEDTEPTVSYVRDETWWRQEGVAARINHRGKRLLARIRAALEPQKASGDPFNLLHDKEGWAATGGSEEERLAILNESPRVLEIATPFNKGWYFHDSEYPEEGTQGPYRSREDAEQAARLAGYDPDSVTFIEQKAPDSILQRYAVEHLRREIAEAIEGAEGETDGLALRSALQRLVAKRMGEAVKELRGRGVLVPPDDDVQMEMLPPTAEDLDCRQVRMKVTITNPERYPEFVRELAEAGLIEPHVASLKFGGGR